VPQARPVAGEMPADDNVIIAPKLGVSSRVRGPELDGGSDNTAEPGQEHGHVEPFDLIRILVTVTVAGLVWFRVWEPLPHVSPIGIAGVIFGGWPIFREAFENLRQRCMTMELSMAIALLAALGIGEFVTALIITAFVLAAEVLEGLTVGRGRRAIGDLLDLLPRSAWIVKDGDGARPIEVPMSELRPGDRVLIRPGARIPVDGQVLSGNSSVEEAAITGEPLPQDKLPGSLVFAGTLNQTGALEVAVESLGRDTTFGRIVEAVEKAEQTRAPIQRLADRLAGYLVYFALGSATLTLLITHNLRSTISVIIVAGACGIAAGTPLAILGAIGRAARQGAIIKGGVYLEQLAKTDTVLLDKTGPSRMAKPAWLWLNRPSVIRPTRFCRSQPPLNVIPSTRSRMLLLQRPRKSNWKSASLLPSATRPARVCTREWTDMPLSWAALFCWGRRASRSRR
jgi:cation transport ATPase